MTRGRWRPAVLAGAFLGTGVFGVRAEAASKYAAMADEIGGLLTEALGHYKKGNAAEAKAKTEAAYFEVFENLEGPIRVNVSAKVNYELEEEFSAIRKMFLRGEPAGAVEARIAAFMVRLRAVLPELEGGVELVAAAASGPDEPGASAAPPGGIEPAWLEAFENIKSGLGSALEAYKRGDAGKAAALVDDTLSAHYNNGVFEVAIRSNLSQRRNFEHVSRFSDVAGMIQAGQDAANVAAGVAGLLDELQKDLPGLPLVPGAVSKRTATRANERGTADRDWTQVTAELFRRLDEAAALFAKGETRRAVGAVQGAYFDVFEESGMEARVGARDTGLKDALEGHFRLLAERMRSGASPSELQGPLAAMRRDFERAAALIGRGNESPLALFFYSLTIILREGIEAILIITMIIAFLVKTGHQGKVKVIYHGCVSAVALSFVTALALRRLLKTSAASQEALEGATMLLAAAVLFGVSYWLLSKAEARKWTAYINDRVGASVSARSLKALWFAAFLAVYREGAETVLFYQALASGSAASGATSVAGGFLVGCALLAGLFLAMRTGAVKLPVKPFFLLTGALLYFMSFVFSGKGMMELAAGKVFEPTFVPWLPTIPFLGMYPYFQTAAPQGLIALAAAAGFQGRPR